MVKLFYKVSCFNMCSVTRLKFKSFISVLLLFDAATTASFLHLYKGTIDQKRTKKSLVFNMLLCGMLHKAFHNITEEN